MKVPASIPFYLFALLAFPLLPKAAAQTPFTYQGKLESNGAPLTGTVNIRLGLYAASSGLSPIRQETMVNVPVTSGLFTVTPATFTIGDFPGGSRWLQIEVSDDGGTTYTPLTPRQQVTYTPYAMHAVQADSAASVTGTVFGSQIAGYMNPVRLDTGTTNATITFSPAAGAPFAVGNANKVTNLNSDLFDGLDSTAFLRTTGGTLTGNLYISSAYTALDFGSSTRQMINLWGGSAYGIGVQTDTLYQRTNVSFGWYRGGSHSDTALSPGFGGSSLMTLSDSLLMLRPGIANSTAGQGPIRIGFGDVFNGEPYVSIGESDTDDEMDIRASKINIAARSGLGNSISFGATTGQHVVLFENASDTYGMGVQAGTEYFRTGDHFAWYKDGVHSDTAFSPGAGGTTLMTLSSDGNMNLSGALSTTVLTIRGGADVAEPFDMTGPDEMEPGSVVVIDEDNPGKLKLSSEECDTRVAGIISGAGGVKPGLRLHQDGVMEGKHHVALSGRVYVKADDTGGAIKPGDLLTTSSHKGRAMKVTDHNRSQGAILGKAMTPIDVSSGLVLVLVTLQ